MLSCYEINVKINVKNATELNLCQPPTFSSFAVVSLFGTVSTQLYLFGLSRMLIILSRQLCYLPPRQHPDNNNKTWFNFGCRLEETFCFFVFYFRFHLGLLFSWRTTFFCNGSFMYTFYRL